MTLSLDGLRSLALLGIFKPVERAVCSFIRLAHSLLRPLQNADCRKSELWPGTAGNGFQRVRKETHHLNTRLPVTTSAVIASDNNKAEAPKKYKSVPENWKTLPEAKFRQVISDLEAVLFDISADGVRMNSPDGRIPESALNRWAEHLRAALKALTGGH